MKENIGRSYRMFLLVAVVSLTSFMSSAQTTGSATFTSAGCVELESGSTKDKYIASVSELDFASAEEMVKSFGYSSDNLVTFTYDQAIDKAVIYIHKNRVEDPASNNASWWNNYLSTQCLINY